MNTTAFPVSAPVVWAPRRVAMSRLHIAIGCPGSHRPDTVWTTEPESWSMRSGKAFHEAVEVYPTTPDIEAIGKKYRLTARQVEMLTNQVAAARPWLQRNYRPTWRAEVAFAYDPITGTVRDLHGEDRNTLPGEWYGRADVIDPTTGLVLDYKSGRRPLDPPRSIPQAWGLAGIVARRFGLTAGSAAILQVDEVSAVESAHPLTADDLTEAQRRMRVVAERITPSAPYAPGPWCSYCPGKKTCGAYAAFKANPPQVAPEAPLMTLKVIESRTAEPKRTAPTNGRMSLDAVRTGRIDTPLRVLIHGADKVGKSSYASGAPNPVFIGLEGGLEQLGVARFPEPQSFDDVLSALANLREDPRGYKTVVIDPINWLEPMVFAKVCEEYGKSNIDEVLGGFQKGQARAVKYWDQMLAALDALRDQRRMNVILIAHTAVRNQKNPDALDWGSFQPAMDKVGAERMKQWADAILFARLEEFAKVDQAGKVKGRSTGARILHTQPNAAYAAGNRYGLPETLPLSWAEFADAIAAGQGKAEDIKKEIAALATELGVEARAAAFVATASDDVGKLSEVLNALQAKKEKSA